MRQFILASLILVLAACGQSAPTAATSQPAQQSGSVMLGGTKNLPDWLFIARQRDCPESDCVGEVFFNQRTITRNEDGTADIWTQTHHSKQQPYVVTSSNTVTTVHYQLEREHYRFQCTEGKFTVVERQIMGAGETVVARDTPNTSYRVPVESSLVPLILPIACHGH